MPLAMCNVISANFVIYRPHQPPLYISTENTLNNGTIFLVYGKGHYDGVTFLLMLQILFLKNNLMQLWIILKDLQPQVVSTGDYV